MNDAVLEHTGVDFYACRDGAEAIEKAKSLGLEIEDKTAPVGKVLLRPLMNLLRASSSSPRLLLIIPLRFLRLQSANLIIPGSLNALSFSLPAQSIATLSAS